MDSQDASRCFLTQMVSFMLLYTPFRVVLLSKAYRIIALACSSRKDTLKRILETGTESEQETKGYHDVRGVNVHAPVESGPHPTHEAGQALEERVLPCTRDGLRSIGGPKLAEDIGDM